MGPVPEASVCGSWQSAEMLAGHLCLPGCPSPQALILEEELRFLHSLPLPTPIPEDGGLEALEGWVEF